MSRWRLLGLAIVLLWAIGMTAIVLSRFAWDPRPALCQSAIDRFDSAEKALLDLKGSTDQVAVDDIDSVKLAATEDMNTYCGPYTRLGFTRSRARLVLWGSSFRFPGPVAPTPVPTP